MRDEPVPDVALPDASPSNVATQADATRPALLAGAATLLGLAITVRDGLGSYSAFVLLAASLAFTAAAVLLPAPRMRRFPSSLLAALLVGLIALQTLAMTSGFAGAFAHLRDAAEYRPALWAVPLAGACGAAAVLDRARRWWWFGGLLALHLGLGVFVIHTVPHPPIDVYVFQRDACRALLAGENPYAMTFVDLYGGQEQWYAPGVVRDGRLLFGFPYMPLSLLLALPGHVLAGDYRYAQLVAMSLSAILIARISGRAIGVAAGGLLLLTPNGFYVVRSGWTEPFIVLLLCLTAWTAVRRPRWMPWLLGLFLSAKQYLPAAGVATVLLADPRRDPRGWLRLMGKAAVIALAVNLPLMLWDWRAFWWSAVVLQVRQPFRFDALSFLALAAGMKPQGPWPHPPAWIAFAALAIALALAVWRCPRTPAGFAQAVTFTFFIFFAFNKQAFANYYYLVIGGLCCSIALMDVAVAGDPDPARFSLERADIRVVTKVREAGRPIT